MTHFPIKLNGLEETSWVKPVTSSVLPLSPRTFPPPALPHVSRCRQGRYGSLGLAFLFSGDYALNLDAPSGKTRWCACQPFSEWRFIFPSPPLKFAALSTFILFFFPFCCSKSRLLSSDWASVDHSHSLMVFPVIRFTSFICFSENRLFTHLLTWTKKGGGSYILWLERWLMYSFLLT